MAKDENYLEALQPEIEKLEAMLKKDKADDLQKFRDEISEMLKAEILARYYYSAGRLEGSLVTDPDVLKAIEILHDRTRYQSILKGK